jgi:hypothetical protein
MTGARRWSVPLWLRLAPLVVVLAGVGMRTLAPVDDPDTWWHLRAGADLRRVFDLVGPDPWPSNTSRTWIRHQWLPEIAASVVHDAGGLAALAWLVPMAWVLAVVATYAVTRMDAGVVVATVVSVCTVVAMSVSISPRPQSLSFPLAVVAAGAWLRSARDGRARWWLVPLTFGWACCHGFWFIAPALGVLTAAGQLLERAPRRWVARSLVVSGVALAAAAVTPVGPRLLLAPFQVDSITAYIQEWQPAPARLPAFVMLAVMIVVALVLRFGRALASWTEVGVLGVAAYLGVTHGRGIALAAAITAPVLARAIQDRLPLARERPGRAEVAATVVAAVVGLASAALLAPAVASRPGPLVPTGLDPALARLTPGTVVCNTYDTGGWLLWRHRQLVPIIDGRTELYAVRDLDDYRDLIAASPRWRDVVAARGCRVALVRTDEPIAAAMRRDGWELAARDRDTLLLTRT